MNKFFDLSKLSFFAMCFVILGFGSSYDCFAAMNDEPVSVQVKPITGSMICINSGLTQQSTVDDLNKKIMEARGVDAVDWRLIAAVKEITSEEKLAGLQGLNLVTLIDNKKEPETEPVQEDQTGWVEQNPLYTINPHGQFLTTKLHERGK